MRRLIIAIDGPAASGKTTTARLVAQRLGYLHIDTGAMYRALTFRVLEDRMPLTDVDQIGKLAERSEIRLERSNGGSKVFLDDRDVTGEIRSPAVTNSVSLVSSYRGVRDILVREQRRMAEGGGVVLEGRDIGTVVLPKADLKIYLVARVSERVKRRMRELKAAGAAIDEQNLEREILERDRFDSTREASPLRKAQDAIELDTSELTVEEQVQFVINEVEQIIQSRRD